MKIGLFGGSFNPPHAGHRLVAETALKRLGLDRVWWLVTPGNPLKQNDHLPSQASRIAACRAFASHPRMIVTGIEKEIGTAFTQETVSYLLSRCKDVRFIWIMGADSLIGFHRWQAWRQIASSVPIAVVDRPGATLKATAGRAAKAMETRRIRPDQALNLPLRRPPAWIFLHGPRSPLSSTFLRNRRNVIKSPSNRG
jgi:nicotinate-nucleotide adenylyltransferase